MINILHVYTGNGKGKTTAAIGLAIRALGSGQRVYIMQFMKGLAYSEHNILKHISPNIFIETTGKPFFLVEDGKISKEELEKLDEDVVFFSKDNPPLDYINIIENGFYKATSAINSGNYDLIILDEINIALYFNLLNRKLIENLLDNVIEDIDIVFTGRNAPQWVVDRADLVTEMLEVKHYYHKGIMARKGIEN